VSRGGKGGEEEYRYYCMMGLLGALKVEDSNQKKSAGEEGGKNGNTPGDGYCTSMEVENGFL